jgi:two-component system, cell cycle response regulator DivK
MDTFDHPPSLLEGWDIVVIDDEEDSLEVITVLLKEYGATVHTADNGATGVERILQVNPKFVISDLSMPDHDGWSVIHDMRLHPKMVDIPAFALTSHAMKGDRERAIAAGFHNYLTKPLRVDTFMSDLLKLLTDVPELEAILEGAQSKG